MPLCTSLRRALVPTAPILALALALAVGGVIAPKMAPSQAEAQEAAPDTSKKSKLQKLLKESRRMREAGELPNRSEAPAPPPLPAGVTRITDTPGQERQARWAPDGKSLYYVYREGKSSSIRHLDLETGSYEVLSDPAVMPSGLDIDPRGEYLVYDARSGLGQKLWVIRLEDRQVAKLTPMGGDERETYPCYNHTGKKIYYARSQPGIMQSHPTVIDRDGENMRILLEEQAMHLYPTLSSDGERLAWIHRLGAANRLRILNTQISSLYQDYEIEDYSIGTIVWTPGDQRLLLSLVPEENPAEGYDLVLYDLETSEISPFLDLGRNELEGRFSPDGTQIVLRSDWGGQYDLYLYELP